MEVTFSPSIEEVVTVAFNISITDDTAVESNEQFEVFLNTSQAAVLIEREASSAIVNIIDDDSKYADVRENDKVNMIVMHIGSFLSHK